MKTKNSLKNLSKLELLELLAEQEREIEQLKQKLQQTEQQLEQRTLRMQQAGNIAQAALALNNVFEAAQNAADQYLASVKELYGSSAVELSAQGTAKGSAQAQAEPISTTAQRVQPVSSVSHIKSSTVTVDEILQSLNEQLHRDSVLVKAESKTKTTDQQEKAHE